MLFLFHFWWLALLPVTPDWLKTALLDFQDKKTIDVQEKSENADSRTVGTARAECLSTSGLSVPTGQKTCNSSRSDNGDEVPLTECYIVKDALCHL